MTLKSLFELSPDERAHLTLRLGERLDALNAWRAQIRDRNSFEPEPDEIYDIAFYGFSGIGMRIGRGVLSKAEREAYTAEMRAAGIERHRTFARLALAIVNAQIAEVEMTLERLASEREP